MKQYKCTACGYEVTVNDGKEPKCKYCKSVTNYMKLIKDVKPNGRTDTKE